MKRQINEDFVTGKKYKVNGQLAFNYSYQTKAAPPSWVEVWPLPDWMKKPGEKQAQGHNVIAKWVKDDCGEWFRLGHFRWSNPLKRRAYWDEENDHIIQACGFDGGAGSWSLGPEIHKDIQEQTVIKFHGYARRPGVFSWPKQSKTQNEMRLFIHWNMNINAVDYAIRKGPVVNPAIEKVVLKKGLEETLVVSNVSLYSAGSMEQQLWSFVTAQEGGEEFPSLLTPSTWNVGAVNRWDSGYDALFLYGNDEVYKHQDDPRSNGKEAVSVWEERMKHPLDRKLWNYWMHGAETNVMRKFSNSLLVDSPHLKWDYYMDGCSTMEAILSLIPVLSRRKTGYDSVFIAFDLVVRWMSESVLGKYLAPPAIPSPTMGTRFSLIIALATVTARDKMTERRWANAVTSWIESEDPMETLEDMVLDI